jgi:hypothetical protein
MALLVLNAAITVAETAAERLQALAESKLDKKSLAEIREAQHALGNLRQELIFLNEQLFRLQMERDNLLKELQGRKNRN